jgi:hypothetical protein
VHWALDGKVLRGSHRQAPPRQSGQEVLNVYAVKPGYLEHCQPIANKGYEAATAQAFVVQRNCAGKVITAEALHTPSPFLSADPAAGHSHLCRSSATSSCSSPLAFMTFEKPCREKMAIDKCLTPCENQPLPPSHRKISLCQQTSNLH